MKKLLMIIIVLLLNSKLVNTQDYWTIVNTPPDININSVELNLKGDIYTGVSYTTGGGLYKTSDDGLSWELLGFGSEGVGPIEINEFGYIYVLVDGIHRSVDDGLTWVLVYESITGGHSIKYYPGGLMFASGGTGSYVNPV